MQPPPESASTAPGEFIGRVRDLLPFLLHVPVTYRFVKKDAVLEGFVTDGGYACACPADASCGYRGKVLSALQFEKHAGAESKNQNGHIFLSNGTSLYALFQALRDVPAEAFAEEFEAAAGVPMTMPAAEASPAPQGPRQGHQPGAPASWEPNGVRVDGATAEPPSAPAPARRDVEMLTEEEKASLCLLGLRESCSTTQSDLMHGIEGPAAEQIEDAAGGDHVMPDAKEIRNGAGEQRPRYSSLSTITPVKVRVTETKYQLDSYLKDVRGLLSTGLLEGFKVTYKKDEVEKIGRISGQGYSCGCSECNYSSNVMNACEFEQHSGQSSNNQNDHIFLETGISLFKVVKALKHYRLNMLGEFFEDTIGFPPNMDEYNKWKASFQKRKDYSDAVASDGSSTQSSRELTVGEMISSLKESAGNSISNLNWSASKRRSDRQFKRGGTETSTPVLSGSEDKGVSGLSTGTSKKNGTEETLSENTAGPLSTNATISQEPLPNCNIDSKSKETKSRDTTLHPLIFKEGGLPDNNLLTYKLKNGEALKQGYKRGTGIVCNCCNQEFTPSHFEEHAGMGRRRQPYRNIYTSEGVTLHKLALQLQDRLNSNEFGNANVSSFSDYPNLTSSGCGKEPSTTSGPIIPLKRTLQEIVVETEMCYFCGDGRTTLGNIDPDTIVFCNQCERPCHIRCYNDRIGKKKVPLEILKEYTRFCFLCCEKCRLLRDHLDEGLEKCEEIAFLRRIRSNICWRLLSGMNASSELYMPQVIDILKDAFAETAEHSGVFSDMVYAKNVEGETDFRGMYCAVLTASTHVVSAAILKVRMEQVAELVLIATRRLLYTSPKVYRGAFESLESKPSYGTC
uniref:Zinc finger PHD-type domain-containing protein n=1 Tax=Setaria italica TaxID=4555 RepID=K4A5T1_SETIT